MFDDCIVTANVIGVTVCRDKMVDSIDILVLEVRDYVGPALTPVTGIDEHRLTRGFDQERGISLADVDMVDLEFSIDIGSITWVEIVRFGVVGFVCIRFRLTR